MMKRITASLILLSKFISFVYSKEFPSSVVGAYASWNECDDKILVAAQQGANVILWFSINLLTDGNGSPTITTGIDFDCVANITSVLRYKGLPTTHMISIGGWDAPHADTSNSPRDVYLAWKKWNEETIARPDLGFYGFDGFDWDLEGNDDFTSPYNYFTLECLDLMGQMSQFAKADGYFVSMAPAQSYLDSSSSLFDRYVNHTDPQWDSIVPGFAYHGHNVYAYLVSKYRYTSIECHVTNTNGCITASRIPTFDMISIQLYESYSRADYNYTQTTQPFHEYLINFVTRNAHGWMIDFKSDTAVTDVDPLVSVSPSQLVIGLANGWAAPSDGKVLYVPTSELRIAYDELKRRSVAPKGFMYWDIADDGIVVNGTMVYMSLELNSVMHLRK